MAPVITRLQSYSSIEEYDEQIPLGEYLFLRVCQINPRLKSVFGIPGDFNLNLLEHLYADSLLREKGVKFVGLCNELNASYTADGYSKIIQGLSVLITTFGVGELSALNGIAGAFAEYAPVLHIVGTTSTKRADYAKTCGAQGVQNFHHLVQNKNSLMAPNHDVYKPLVEPFSVIQESLTMDGFDNEENLKKIDRVLIKICQENRPGYLFIPCDIPDITVSKARLEEAIITQELAEDDIESKQLVENITDRILDKLYQSSKPSIIGDALVSRFHYDEVFTKFISKLPSNFVKLFTTNMARNIDETLPNFVGTYFGKVSPTTELQKNLEQDTDLLIDFGYLNVETNTAGYTRDYSNIKDYIEIHPDYVFMDNEYIAVKDTATDRRRFSMGDLIQSLNQKLDTTCFINNNKLINNISYKFTPRKWHTDDATIDQCVVPQSKLIDFFNDYLQPNDILMVETCTFLFAVPDLKFPPGVTFLSQSFYGSIGYAIPATLGVSLAEKDLGTNRRIILVQGDGSAQMTVQELSTFLRHDLINPKIFLINNEGYTVERIIKGPTRSYNDIQASWKWTELLKIFGDEHGARHVAATLKNAAELENFRSLPNNDKIELIELIMGKMDAPERFSYISGNKPPVASVPLQ
ncbi:Thiamine pyrophosphate enzyme, central domain-containing protein [Debaryomyces fabryi]|uniref:Thiamine pyrophosphate enzyme, central domain-containing protein n=1 Tax=Debaryomyces fabryi TaxID=58627 RepID=A0A0V1PZS0_9ASCO|nr:Thiamine pyrophosphate enzyme, central domain-containing protein [Debaryomyces fabryi]KSA01612.1 Thiamine pyrophosphate enzyme, central domain-containing protein [Debaryomyces fabryi]CUM47147.1 unnamed protein product [Debaryomyces fabryi]